MSVAQQGSQGGPRHIVRASIIWVVASILGILFDWFGLPHILSLPPVASVNASDINMTMMVFTLLATPVFMMVIVFAGYSIFNFNNHGRPTSDGPGIRGNAKLAATWITLSVVLVSFLLGWGLFFLAKIDAAPTGDVLQVQVVGEQWQWNYVYPQYGNATSNVLELPVGRPVEFTLTSVDVNHSFWIPALGIKEDAMPGVTTHISVTPTVEGTYTVRCAELCGLYHSYMEGHVQVVKSAAFQDWLLQQTPNGTFPTQYPEATGYAPQAQPAAVLGDADIRRSFI